MCYLKKKIDSFESQNNRVRREEGREEEKKGTRDERRERD